MTPVEHVEVDVAVIGAGQAGLATAYWLRHEAPGVTVTVLEAGSSAGQSWHDRWDSLRLFTPRHFSQLGGMRFPAGASECPTRLEMADYLTRYAEHHRLDLRTRSEVIAVRRDGTLFTLVTEDASYRARHVVIATGPFREPALPAAAAGLDAHVTQLHSSQYRRPTDLPPGSVVVVGGGDSAAQIALELSATRDVTLVAPRVPWFLPSHVLGVSTYSWLALGGILRADPKRVLVRQIRRRPESIFGHDLRDAVRAGSVRLLPHRVIDAASNRLRLADNSEVTVESVVWCTGFRPDYAWLHVTGALDSDGAPVHTRGASPVPGLHWMGLPWQARLDSSIIHGANADARMTARRIAGDVST